MATKGTDVTPTASLPKLIGILRGLPPFEAEAATESLVEAGFTCIEVTADSPDAVRSLRAIARNHGDQITLGLGTVRTVADVKLAAQAQASFVLSPHLDESLIEAAHDEQLLAVPGAFTATEISQAWQAGADLVKLFPASYGGADYIRQIRAPLPEIPLIATGGVTKSIGHACLLAGCAAVAVGVNLIDADAVAARDWRRLTVAAREYIAALEVDADEHRQSAEFATR